MLTQVDRPIVSAAPSKPSIEGLKLFGDGASLAEFSRLHAQGMVTGFTTNPTLMFKAGITDWYAYDPAAVALFGVQDGETIAGFIHLGTLAEPPLERPRPNMAHKVERRP